MDNGLEVGSKWMLEFCMSNLLAWVVANVCVQSLVMFVGWFRVAGKWTMGLRWAPPECLSCACPIFLLGWFGGG